MAKQSRKTAHNPGLSDRAWKEVHQKLIKYNQKYKNEIIENRMKGDVKIG